MPRPRLGPIKRVLLRTPSHLYDWGLGPLLGPRFLRLTHVGRRTGRTHRTVLEVVARDRSTGSVVVVAGLGRTADWYRNILAGGEVEVENGRNRFSAAHRLLGAAEAVGVLADYERRNRWARPVVRLVLGRLTGRRYDGSPDARARLAEQLSLIALRPAPTRQDDDVAPLRAR